MRTLLLSILLFLSFCGFDEDGFVEAEPKIPESAIVLRPLPSPSDTIVSDTTDFPSEPSDTIILPSDTTGLGIPEDFDLVYETSFEEVKAKNRHGLDWDFPHWVEYAAMHREDGGLGNGMGGGRLWVEEKKAHTGEKSIGLALHDIEKSRRAELTIFPQNYLSEAYFVSYWVYLPGDWGLFDPSIDWDWFEIGNPFISGGTPYAAIHITSPDTQQEFYTINLDVRNEEGKMNTYGKKRMRLPKERWFNIRYYVHRDRENGAIKLWFDDQLIGEQSGIPTMRSTTKDFTISIAKIYHEIGDTSQHQLWIDDLQLFTKTEE